MKTSFRLPFRFALALAAASALAPLSASADARLRVVADSALVHARPDSSSPVLSTAPRDAILFPSGDPEGLWTPVDPPADAALWLPAEFVDGSRVLARSVPLRTGPGLEHDVAGTLSRNATVMRLGESGDWLKIAPPSSARLWVRTADVAPVAESSAPIREVEPVAALPIAPPSSTFLVGQTPPITPSVPTPDAPAPEPVPVQVAAAPVAPPPPPAPAPAPPPARPAVAASSPVSAPAAWPPRTAPHPAPVVAPRPAPSPVHPVRPAAPAPAPAVRPSPVPQHPRPAPAPSAPSAQPRPDPALVAQLDLRPGAPQARPVSVTGELRNAPFAKGSPSHFKLLPRAPGDAECLVHGNPAVLRPLVGRRVVLRGASYTVLEATLPVVVPATAVPAP